MNKQEILAALNSLTDEERLDIITHYCVDCGSINPRCQCWNDD